MDMKYKRVFQTRFFYILLTEVNIAFLRRIIMLEEKEIGDENNKGID